MMKQSVIMSALVAFVVSFLVVMIFGTGETTVVERFSEPVGLVEAQISNFDAVSVKQFTEGGGVITITNTDGTETLTQSQMLDNNIIVVAETQGEALTLTLPAATTMTTLIPNAGDKRSWMIENAHTVAATTTTIAAGSGIDLQEPDGQNVVIGINNYAWLTCFREAGATVVCRVDETIPAD